jgi:hypothetical protein
MFRVLIPFNTTWFGFFVALLILTITATVYLHTHRLIGSSQALVAVINILGGSAIAYLAIYGMGFEQLDTGVLFYVKRGANADWFSLATVLANCLVASWVIYIWSEQRINGKRAAMYFGFPIIISGYLVFLWYQLGWPLAIALPTWIRFPVRPDWFNFLVELLGGLALFKAIVDRLKSRTSNKHLLFRFIVALSTIVLLVVGWYSLARVLPMPTVPDWLVILVSASTTPVVLAEMFSHLKRRRFRISTFSLLNSAFLILIATLLIVWNLPRVLAWAFAEYDQGHRHCNITDPFYKLAIHWFPLWS